jgi:hypothetical protein
MKHYERMTVDYRLSLVYRLNVGTRKTNKEGIKKDCFNIIRLSLVYRLNVGTSRTNKEGINKK